MSCTCPSNTAELLRARLAGTAPHCPTHDPAPPSETPEPLALNSEALESTLAAKLTGTTHTETENPA